jgi:hypothetical protein
MAYGIMGGSTYQTTRRAKCICFDGESATLFGSGQLDTHMCKIWGNLSGPARLDTDGGGRSIQGRLGFAIGFRRRNWVVRVGVLSGL